MTRSTRGRYAEGVPKRAGRGAPPAENPKTIRVEYQRGGAIPTTRNLARVPGLLEGIREVALEIAAETEHRSPAATKIESLLHLAGRMATEYRYIVGNPHVTSLSQLENT